MRAGNLRHTVAFQELTATADNFGGETHSWSDVSGCDAVPAAIWPIKGSEKLDAMKQEHEVTHRIRIRYRSGLTAAMQVVFDSRTFVIQDIVNPDERNITLELLCKEEVT